MGAETRAEGRAEAGAEAVAEAGDEARPEGRAEGSEGTGREQSEKHAGMWHALVTNSLSSKTYLYYRSKATRQPESEGGMVVRELSPEAAYAQRAVGRRSHEE